MLNYSDYGSHLDTILRAALQAADPAEAVRRALDPAELSRAGRVFVVGAGKAGVAMGETAVELVGERLAGGVIAVPNLPRDHPPPLSFAEGGHPHPTLGSLQAGEAMAALLAQTAANDLVLAVISGGGSALLDHLNPGFGLNDLQALTDVLLRSGAPIQDLNCVRKHLSRIKGGGLARMAQPARLLALILSDVIGDPLDVIASGPTVPDPTTVAQAQSILDRHDLGRYASVLHETPKPGDPIFERVANRLIGSNRLAREAAGRAAQALGFAAHVIDEPVLGEARHWWPSVSHMFERAAPHTAWIFGGEPTVTVKGGGKGGRNQELVLAAALGLDGGDQRLVVASMGTDGVDGFSPAAGAKATPESCAQARAQGLDPRVMLDDNDSHSFFQALGDAIVTGPTGTNVNDVVVVLAY